MTPKEQTHAHVFSSLGLAMLLHCHMLFVYLVTGLWGMNKHICLARKVSQYAPLGCRGRKGAGIVWED